MGKNTEMIELFEIAGCNVKFNDIFIPTENIINDMILGKINELVRAVNQIKKEERAMTEKEKIQKLLSCDNCKFATCEQCEISYNDKQLIKKYIAEKNDTINKQKEQIEYLRRSCGRKEECLIEEQQENAELENELKEKDKIIDLMAETIECNQHKNIDMTDFDEVCKKLNCNKKCLFVKIECIKQYFENKAKEV